MEHTYRPFHLALPSNDLAATQDFYCRILGCKLGRTSAHWIDVDMFGHQLVFHDCGGSALPEMQNPVDEHAVPIPHFGVVLDFVSFDALAERVTGQVEMIEEPYVRFAGTPGEQRTLFFRDANGYALEFKAFADIDQLFEPFAD